MCLCLRNTTGARASARFFPSASARDFFLPLLFLSLLFFCFFSSLSLFPGVFFFSFPPLLLPCSYVHARHVRRASHSCQWSLPRARSLQFANIARRGGPRRRPAVIIEHLSDPVSLLLVLLLFFADFLLIFLGRSSMRNRVKSNC